MTTDPRDVLEQACRDVQPGLLTLESGAARRECFLAAVATQGAVATLVLDPVAGPPVDARRATLDFRHADREFVLVGRPRAEGRRVLLDVRRGPDLRPPRSRRLAPVADTAVCSFVTAESGRGRFYLPVLDVGAAGLSLESSVPLPVGTELRELSVLSRTHVIRRGEGLVVHAVTVERVHGGLGYRCGVRLLDPGAAVAAQADQESAEISDRAQVRSILWGLADLGAEARLSLGARALTVRLSAASTVRQELPELNAHSVDGTPIPEGVGRLSVGLCGAGYSFMARVHRTPEGDTRLRPAPVVRQAFLRQEERWEPQPGDGARVHFTHPLEGRPVERPLLDVSADGFAFTPEPGQDVVWAGLPLLDVTLHLPGLELSPPGVVVRTVGAARVGVAMDHLPAALSEQLRMEVLERRDPALVFHDGADLESVLRLHRQVGLLEPAMGRNLEASLERTRREWHAAHGHPDGLVRTVLGQRDGQVQASLNLIRAYDRGWCLQHGAVLHPGVRPTAGELYAALLALVCSRPDGEYLSAFIAQGARSQHAVMDAFFSAHSTPEHRGRHAFSLYTADTLPPEPKDERLRRLLSRDEALVEHAAARVMDPLCARALGIQRGELALRASGEAFRKVGLERGREVWGAFAGEHCVALLLREWASPGLSLSSVLSAAMLLPVRPGLDPDGSLTAALVRLARTRPLLADPPTRLVLLPEGVDDTPVAAAGFQRTAGCCLYAFHRYGLREYHRYVGARYAFLHAQLRGPPREAA